MIVLNPRVIEMCGEESREMLDKLNKAIGEDAARRTKVDSRCGTMIINGVTMPKCVSAPNDIADKVADNIYDFCYEQRDVSKKLTHFAEIEVHNEKFDSGDIPLMIFVPNSDFSKAVSAMGGE